MARSIMTGNRGRTLRSRLFHRAAVLAILAMSQSAASGDTLRPSTTSRHARNEAARAIPFGELNQEAAAKLRDVVSSPSVFRRLPIEAIESDPEMYLFMVRHPEVAIDILNNMGASEMRVRRIDEYKLACDDGNGTRSTVDLVYGTSELHVLYAEGVYEGSMWPTSVRGRAVMLLRSAYQQGARGERLVINQLDVFIKIDNAGAALIARSLHPIMGGTADTNFVSSISFLTRISEAAQVNGPGMVRLAERLRQVDPTTRNQFTELTIQLWNASGNAPTYDMTQAGFR